MKPARFCIAAFAVFAILLSCGCASITTVPVQNGVIATPDLTITAEDDSFTLKTGRFTPPFQSDYQLSENIGPQRANNWASALKQGARRVLVTHGADKFHGVLALNRHWA